MKRKAARLVEAESPRGGMVQAGRRPGTNREGYIEVDGFVNGPYSVRDLFLMGGGFLLHSEAITLNAGVSRVLPAGLLHIVNSNPIGDLELWYGFNKINDLPNTSSSYFGGVTILSDGVNYSVQNNAGVSRTFYIRLWRDT